MMVKDNKFVTFLIGIVSLMFGFLIGDLSDRADIEELKTNQVILETSTNKDIEHIKGKLEAIDSKLTAIDTKIEKGDN